jgi:DNA-binding response OmpR family regulator
LVETLMALDPLKRFQTSTQALEAIREVRRDVEGTPVGKEPAPGMRSVFIIERDERLQDGLRQQFKQLGYRVLLAGDAGRALDRFRQQPYQALIVDARTAGEDSIYVFELVVQEAERHQLPLAGILILSDAQHEEERAKEVADLPTVRVLVGKGVRMKELLGKLNEAMAAAFGAAAPEPAAE